MPPHVFIHPDHADLVEASRAADQHPLPFGQNRSVRGVPRNGQSFSDPGHAQVLAHDAFQSPAQPSAGDLRFRLGGQARVLHPYVLAGGTAVAADPDGQDGGTPPERCVGQPADSGVSRGSLGTAPVAISVIVDDFAFDDRAGSGDLLAGGGQSELVQAAEGRQVRGAVGSIEHGRELSTVLV